MMTSEHADWLWGQLRCPICGGALAEDGAERLTCEACAARFPVVDGVPVLLDETRSLFDIAAFTRHDRTFFRHTALTDRLERRLPALELDGRSRANYRRLAELLLERAAPRVLVVGGSVLGAGMDALLAHCPPIRLVETDVSFGPRTRVICDCHALPFPDGSFDAVVAQAVLEHVVDPEGCVAELHRVLAPDGLVYAETPFIQQVHGVPYDFQRFTDLGLRRLFRDFSEIERGVTSGAGTALAWTWTYLLLSGATRRPTRMVLRALARLTSFPLKYLDRLLLDRPGTRDAASGYFFLGRRSAQRLSDRALLREYRGGQR